MADGFIPIWTTPAGLGSFKDSIEAGFAKAGGGKDWDSFEIMPTVNVMVNDDIEMCRNMFRPMVALYVGGMGARDKNFYNDHITRQGWPDAAKKIQDLYLTGKKGEAMAAVPDELIDAVSLVGPRERIAERVDVWKESGVDAMLLGTAQPEAIQLMAELVL